MRRSTDSAMDARSSLSRARSDSTALVAPPAGADASTRSDSAATSDSIAPTRPARAGAAPSCVPASAARALISPAISPAAFAAASALDATISTCSRMADTSAATVDAPGPAPAPGASPPPPEIDSMAPLTEAMSSRLASAAPASFLAIFSPSAHRPFLTSSIWRPASKTVSVLADTSLRPSPTPSILSAILAIIAELLRIESMLSAIFFDISSVPAATLPRLSTISMRSLRRLAWSANPTIESERALTSSRPA